MSRRSQAFSDGQPAFSWDVSRTADGQFRCVCRSVPGIEAVGTSEQDAILNARAAMETHVDRAEIGTGVLSNRT